MTSPRRKAPQVVRFGDLQHRPEKRKPHGVRWVIDGKPYSKWFVTKPPANRYRSRLMTAYDDGERFALRTGEPESWRPQGAQTPVYDWACDYLAEAWGELAPRTRNSYVEALARFVALAVSGKAPKAPEGIWWWLNRTLRPETEVDADDPREKWLRRYGLTLGELDRLVLADIDTKLGLGAQGQQLAPRFAGRLRKYSKACIRRAVELEKIPVDPWPVSQRGRSRRKANRVVEEVDVRRLPEPVGMAAILEGIVERSQPYTGTISHGISAYGYYGGLRPSETVMLRRWAIDLPDPPDWVRDLLEGGISAKEYLDTLRRVDPAEFGWGLMEVVTADDGYDNDAVPKTGTRQVPMPPPLVAITYVFLAVHPRAPQDLMFRTSMGTRPDMSHWRRTLRRACHHVGAEVLTPYDLRHACATTMLRAGVPLGIVALWLGHSVKTLVAHYIQALAGDEAIAKQRIEEAHGLLPRDRPANNAQPRTSPTNNGQRRTDAGENVSPAQGPSPQDVDGGPDGI